MQRILLFAASLSLVIVLLCSQSVLAATVTLANGDHLTGTISRLQDGKLYLQTPYAEKELEINWQDVARIESDAEVTVQLHDGEIVKGQLQPVGDGSRFSVTGATVRAEALSLAEIQAINPPDQVARFKGSITLGGSKQSGNTDRTSANVAVDAVRKTKRHRVTLGFLYNYASESGDLTERNTFGRLKYDYFYLDKGYVYLNTEFLNDRFKDLKLRTVVGPGAGYQLWDDDKKSLAFEGGLAYYNVDRSAGSDDSWLSARLATIFDYTFDLGPEFSDTLTVYPSLENSDFTLRNEAAITSPVAYGWALQLRNIIEHDSNPAAPGVKKTDYSWILGLNYAF